MSPDTTAIGASIQTYLDLGYDWQVAVDKATRADRLSRRSSPRSRDLAQQLEVASDCCRWITQHGGSHES
jgi:hypothetical protein